MAETVADKGRRLLVDGRLRVKRVEGPLVVAECRGDTGKIYALGFDPRSSEWRCTCAATRQCSHLYALKLVILDFGEGT